MKVNVLVPTEMELKPGDDCILHSDVLSTPRTRKVNRIVESRKGVKVVFSDGTWRPIHTYGITWRKA